MPFDPRGKLTVQELLNGAWLTDTEINLFLNLLRKEFKNVNGLEDPLFISNDFGRIKKTEYFIRVVISNNNHWVCIAGGIYGDDDEEEDIFLFDSSPRNVIDKVLGENIGNCLTNRRKSKGKILIRLQNTQKQQDCFCGYFALANATALCFGIDPETLLFDELAIRQHFIDCVYRGKKLTMFPFRETSRRREHKYFEYQFKKQ